MAISATDLLELSVEDRIRLVGEIWDSIAEVPEQVEVSPEIRRLLDQRLADYRANPDAGSPWHEVRAKILANR